MKKLLLLLVALGVSCASPEPSKTPPPSPASPEEALLEHRAQGITITRDDWGIAHISAKTDADAVFGMMYAQAEDDFNRIETNYLNAMGRLAEAEGEREIYRDLRMKLFIDPAVLEAKYKESPKWLQSLMDAYADGLNYYLATHPEVQPRVIKYFRPWMALAFTEGSIGGDIEQVSLAGLEALYGKKPVSTTAAIEPIGPPAEPTGSNGFAVAPANAKDGHALLYINPHTSFFFRSELQVSSDEGLNAYGAVTWGQFFIYQGFNERAGWMHTSSSADNIDEYVETIVKVGKGFAYRYGREERPLVSKVITVPYKNGTGLAERQFTVYYTHHGPIVREADGKWVSVRLMQEPIKALTQSFMRTKATSLKAFRETMDLHTNSSNNTVYADADGNIAYFHANFIPKRNPRFDWSKPVNGNDPATEWNGVHSFDESPNAINPPNGWLQNTNNWPYSVTGPNSPKRANYPAYVDTGSENPRGVHAIRVLDKKKDFTLDSLVAAGFDNYLPEFEIQIPLLVKAYEQAAAANPLKKKLTDQVALLKGWDYRWSARSAPTALAVYYGEDLWQRVTPAAKKAGVSTYEYMAKQATAAERLESLSAASDKLVADFGSWQTAWGEINRFQRLTGDIVQPFNDSGLSTPVAFTSARWGSLASFGARTYPGTKRMYGTSGNSFVAAVEFGDKVRARAVTAGGLNSDPRNKHFNDQAERYANGNLRDVYFYKDQLKGHTEREYRPGK